MTVLLPGSDAYESLRTGIFNGRTPSRRPAAVVTAHSPAEVADAVRLAASRGWQVAPRSGGHSWAGWSVRDDALLLDLSGLREMSYADGAVTVSPAIRGGDELNPYLAGFGRFFCGGHCPSVGLGGFLLQGGQGWNARGWGWAAEYVTAVDVVTADGRLVRADPDHDPDLYWAARGAGPGFPGVVTRFHLRTRPLPRALAQTVLGYPIELYDEVMTWLHGIHTDVADTVEIVAVTQTPPGSDRPVLLVTGLAFTDTDSAAAAALAPLHGCPYPALFRVEAEPTSLDEQLARQRIANPRGHRYRVDNAWLHGPADAVVPAARTAFTALPTPESFTIWFSMAPLRALPDMAFSLQTEIYCASYVVSTDPARDGELRDWLATAMGELAPVTAGQYLGDSDFAERSMKVMGDAQWARLQRIRSAYDPDRRFAGYLGPATNLNHWPQPAVR